MTQWLDLGCYSYDTQLKRCTSTVEVWPIQSEMVSPVFKARQNTGCTYKGLSTGMENSSHIGRYELVSTTMIPTSYREVSMRSCNAPYLG